MTNNTIQRSVFILKRSLKILKNLFKTFYNKKN